MALKYLSHLDLNKNELQNAVVHPLGTAPSGPAEGQIYYNSTSADKKMYYYDGTAWQSFSGDIESIASTTSNQLTVTNSTGPNPTLAIITSAVIDNGTALATGDQIHDFVTTEIANISLDILGTANEVEITNGSGVGNGSSVTIGLPNDVTIGNNLTVTNDLTINGNVVLGNATTDTVDISGDLTVDGNLTVSGTTTTVNSNNVNIGDSIITLNSDETLAATQDAGIEIERGTDTNVNLIYDETNNYWTLTNDGSNSYQIATYNDSIENATLTAGEAITITDNSSGRTKSFEIAAEDATDANKGVASFSSTDFTVTSGHVTLNTSSYSYKTSIGDGSTLAYSVSHNLGSLDVIVQLYDNSTYDTVYADVVRTNTNQITVTFASAPSTNDIRVLVYKL